jgi:hypothetical protein
MEQRRGLMAGGKEPMNPVVAFALGGLAFLGASYVLHCKFNMGPWSCQKNDCRHAGNNGERQIGPRGLIT